MKQWFRIGLGCLVFFTLACSLFSPGESKDTRPYENKDFSFTIPVGWNWWVGSGKDYFNFGAQEIAGIYEGSVLFQSAARFVVASAPMVSGTDLESRFTQAYAQFGAIEIGSKQAIKRGNLTGYEITYKRPYGEGWYDWRDIWLERNDVVYVLSCRTNRGEFGKYEEIFNQIIESFRFNN